MNQLTRLGVWLRRIGHCRGFGIHSPNDYWFVRYVINEHWPYYAYSEVGQDDDWLARKLGRLHFRVVNWRQPAIVVDSAHSPYWQAGCRKTQVADSAEKIELCRLTAGQENCREALQQALERTDEHSVIIIDHIYRDWSLWRETMADRRVTLSFDLYYCGILRFEQQNQKKDYIINF